MKFIKNNPILLTFSFFMLIGIAFSGCNKDDEDIVVPKTLEEYKTELSEIVTAEKAEVQNCVVGYNKGDFKSDLYFADYTYEYLLVLEEAEQVLQMSDLTIADIINANYNLSGPGKNFNDNRWISDRRPLNDLIGVCDTLRVHTPEGTEVGMASAEAITVFTEAITNAKAVRGRSSTIERQVAEAVVELNLELEIFEEAIIK